MDFEDRFVRKLFLTEPELESLRDFAQLSFARDRDVIPIARYLGSGKAAIKVVANPTQYNRLTTIANFLEWLARYLVGSEIDKGTSDAITEMRRRIKVRRPRFRGRNLEQERGLDDEQIDALLEVIRLDYDHNPFVREVRRRNSLIILLLFHLGIRRGELLGIRVSDIDFSANQLRIRRRPDEKSDPRKQQPQTKTNQRILMLDTRLAQELHRFVIEDRARIRKARKHDFLFVATKVGPTFGQPLSISAYYAVFSLLRTASPLLRDLTGHKLRHTWNRRFSERMDQMDEPPSEAFQEKMRSYYMGWAEGSGTAEIYNARFTARKAEEASLEMQARIGIRMPRNLKFDHKGRKR